MAQVLRVPCTPEQLEKRQEPRANEGNETQQETRAPPTGVGLGPPPTLDGTELGDLILDWLRENRNAVLPNGATIGDLIATGVLDDHLLLAAAASVFGMPIQASDAPDSSSQKTNTHLQSAQKTP
jgi:hypothetical protein